MVPELGVILTCHVATAFSVSSPGLGEVDPILRRTVTTTFLGDVHLTDTPKRGGKQRHSQASYFNESPAMYQ